MSLILLVEKLSSASAANVPVIIEYIATALPMLEEMRGKRAADFNKTGMIQVRVKPVDKNLELKDILHSIEKMLNDHKSRQLGISDVEFNKNSVHSGKYSSVSFKFANDIYDVVVAKGANEGETFEKELLLKLDNQVKGIDNSEEAISALDALYQVDPDINPGSITNITARSGSTKRSINMSPAEMGKVIADIIIETDKGDKYISVKNSSGKTVGQFGVSKFINDDLTVNVKSEEWIKWFVPFGLDAAKISAGLKAAGSGAAIDFEDIEIVNKNLPSSSKAFDILAHMWGSNYIYLREKGKKFLCMKIDDDFLKNTLLDDLKITKIAYPCDLRKQINVYLESSSVNYKIEYRNPRGKGSIKPTQIQLQITKTKIDF